MAKTILDVLKTRLYRDDSQVKILLVTKKQTDNRVKQNFAYVAVKELKRNKDIDILKMAGLERSVILYSELKKQGIV